MATTTTAKAGSTRTNAAAAAASSSSSANAVDRVAAHTHITGLGLTPEGLVDASSECGLVGQAPAREACGLVVDLIQASQFAGRALLLVGPPGTGKTALATAMAKELGAGTPFCPTTASQMFSQEVKKTEMLQQHFRKALGLRIRETKEVYEGEVTELTVEETQDPLSGNTTSYGKAVSHVLLTVKTAKGTKRLKMDPTMYDALVQENVSTGDVIYIEANSGAVKRVGKSDAYATEFDLEAEDYVPVPKGDVHKKRQVVQDVTLHDLDVANAQPPTASNSNKKQDVMALVAAMGRRPKKTEITDKLRHEINQIVQRYIDEGVAELVPGVLFLDEVHMLDHESFAYLNKCLESTLAPPIVILATNRGVTTVRGTDTASPHGIPLDLLDRLLIVPTHPYQRDDMRRILRIRAQTEGLTVSETALDALADIGHRTASLRFATQLLTPASLVAETAGRAEIQPPDVHQVDALFVDGKASAQKLQHNATGYL